MTANVPHVELETVLSLKKEVSKEVIVGCGHSLMTNQAETLTNDLMLKPCVGLMVVMSSSESFLRIVVLPALSRPSTRIYASFEVS